MAHIALLTQMTIKLLILKNASWRTAAIFFRVKNRNNSEMDWPIVTKFGKLMHIDPFSHVVVKIYFLDIQDVGRPLFWTSLNHGLYLSKDASDLDARNLVGWYSVTVLTISRWRTAALLTAAKSWQLSNGLTDRYDIWDCDAYWHF